ncbi:uncharacterized protein LOC143569473 [Bidens hawaiensis]|uniref:uncharacterized protein LOC143569473 n=1 Tax=Bidens hawaiensis TaxID=980011 RepID=UPI00404906B8
MRRIRGFIWCAYLLADWVATVALGLLVDCQGNLGSSGSSNKEYGDLTLMAFWAPFLLLHLGGPDTITAYALADNELWLRHLLGLCVQTFAACYITLLAWEGGLISWLTIPMLLCGMIKYGERTWVLMTANRDQFRDSALTDTDPGPNYANFMEEFSLKEAEGYDVSAAQVEEQWSPEYVLENTSASRFTHPDARTVLESAGHFFETLNFKRLFVDLILGFQPRDESQAFFEKHDYNTAFEVIEVELGFAYDVFYTKAPIIYTRFGLFFRLMTFCITLTVLVAFSALIGVDYHKRQHVDVVITYILLIGAMLLEVYAVKSLLLSDWANLWSIHNSSRIGGRLIRSLQSVQKGKRWSNSMYQYSLLDFCLNLKSSTFQRVLRLVSLPNRVKNLWEKLEGHRQLEHVPVTHDLKRFIFDNLKERSKNTELDRKVLFTSRGALSLTKSEKYGVFKWAVLDVEFDHSILIWHIATDLCYNLYETERCRRPDLHVNENEWYNYMIFSKNLADYMLYILVMCPFMLPMGIGIIRFRDTCAEATVFFKERSDTSKDDAYEMLRKVSTKVFPQRVKGDRSKSVLFEACKLAASLNEMGRVKGRAKMWKMVGDLWVEILGYAASQCRGFDHAHQLEKGGELLTHVWLLMAHLGITEHFQINDGHGRVKLAVI